VWRGVVVTEHVPGTRTSESFATILYKRAEGKATPRQKTLAAAPVESTTTAVQLARQG
jgi:hypothetical protein